MDRQPAKLRSEVWRSWRCNSCFQGHTHIPGIFTASMEFITPEDCNHAYRLSGEKTMVNVGSVGQPRDNDSRACYVVLDGPEVVFRRLEYPLEDTAQKIYNNPHDQLQVHRLDSVAAIEAFLDDVARPIN